MKWHYMPLPLYVIFTTLVRNSRFWHNEINAKCVRNFGFYQAMMDILEQSHFITTVHSFSSNIVRDSNRQVNNGHFYLINKKK